MRGRAGYGGHVDGYCQLVAELAPLTDLRQGGVQDVIGRRADQAGALGQRDELAGRDVAHGAVRARRPVATEDRIQL
jgi:hypothetical protein